MSAHLIQECYHRAAEAKRMADAATEATTRAKLLEAERRWLIAARSISPEIAVCGPARMTRVKSISQEMKQISKHGPQSLPHRKKLTKFTPENIQQIRQLLTEGKSREEIATLIGVTVGSLQVTCSRFGISLRRSNINAAEELVQRQARHDMGRTTSSPDSHDDLLPELNAAQSSGVVQVEPLQARAPSHGQGETQAPSVSFAITMQYRGHERTTELMFTEDMLSQLVVEAQFRSMSVPELVGELIAAALRNDIFRQVLDAEQAPK